MNSLLLLLPLGLLAGALSGLLGIGGGLVFSPLLLLLGLSPHQALATSTLAIIPTTAAGSLAHLRQGTLPFQSVLAIAGTSLLTGVLFGHLGASMGGWQLLALQALLYGILALTLRPRSEAEQVSAEQMPQPLLGLAAVGGVAGAAGGLLGLGGGLLMVPLMVGALKLPIHHAIRLSTVAVFSASSGAGIWFLLSGRGLWVQALVLGGCAALSASWSAARLQRVQPQLLALMLRLLTLLLALDSARRATLAWLVGG
jgi:uncharacterized membrane protein YfcA